MADLMDMREKDWPKGLYRRAYSYRFKRVVAGQRFTRILGPIPLEEAKRKATRLNFDMDEGRDVGQDRQRVRKTFPAHAQEWLLKKKAVLGDGKSIRRYKAVIDNFTLYLMSKHLEKAPLNAILFT